ncbi:MAG: caspase family protein [Bacteroidia bacterium]|nr:caspase family protein [Bacteroidia bacterium]
MILFLDACHSGQLGANLYTTRGMETNVMEAIREITSPEHGVVVFSASTGNEKSLESPEWKHGAFTLALVRALKDKQADMDKDGLVYLRELDYFLAEEVKKITQGKQHPTTQKPSTISTLPILQVD